MREILFRGKRKDTGEWVEGYYTFYPHGFNEKGKPEHTIRDTLEIVVKLYIVDPKTVCQYTGLTDKNDRKIFEGDILKEDVEDAEETGTDKFIYSVQYSEEYSAFTTSDVIEEGYFEPLGEYMSRDAEVIGNIFDNSDLITANSI